MYQGTTATAEQSKSQAGTNPANTKAILVIAGVLFLVAAVNGIIWLHNQDTVQRELDGVLAADSKNKNVFAEAHYNGLFNLDRQSIVFDLTDVSGETGPVDIFRVFLQFAQSQKDHPYKHVFLAAYGEKKFVIEGSYFHQLGMEYGSQNPLYTMRTFPHHVSTMNGEHPFPEYQGGLFGVLGKEIDEFKQMNAQWYMNDYKESANKPRCILGWFLRKFPPAFPHPTLEWNVPKAELESRFSSILMQL